MSQMAELENVLQGASKKVLERASEELARFQKLTEAEQATLSRLQAGCASLQRDLEIGRANLADVTGQAEVAMSTRATCETDIAALRRQAEDVRAELAGLRRQITAAVTALQALL